MSGINVTYTISINETRRPFSSRWGLNGFITISKSDHSESEVTYQLLLWDGNKQIQDSRARKYIVICDVKLALAAVTRKRQGKLKTFWKARSFVLLNAAEHIVAWNGIVV